MSACRTKSLAAFHLSTLYAEIAERGTYDSFALNLGARIARTEAHVRLAGAKGIAHLNGAQLLGGAQHADFTTVVQHDAPSCTSRQTVKNVLAGRSQGVFQGRIEVARVAQKTDGYQMNQALLLSPDAEIDTKPELEIFADDVKCSHGATVGELDAEQLFYLRSRGIPDAEARSMLVRAFLAEALDAVTRRGGARRAGSRGRRLVGEAGSMNVDDHALAHAGRRAHPRGFPDPAPDDPRQAAGVPRQRRLGAEAARGDRCDARGDGDAIRQRASRPALDERAHHRCL